mgnify:CR=1 FL=1
MKNLHNPVMLKEIISYIPSNKSINVVDATFGGGGYSREILKTFDVTELLAIDRDSISNILSKDLKSKYSNFSLVNDKFSRIDKIVEESNMAQKKFDVILYDLGISSNQIDNSDRGFSFNKKGPLDMRMGKNEKNAFDIVNKFEENNLANIIYDYGEERYSRIIAKEIVKSRNIKFISDTIELSEIIKKYKPKKNYLKKNLHPATKTFQALRIYVNDELNELKNSLNKTIDILNHDGLILVVSFQSLEDRIVKDFFNHNSGKRWRSSRHYPELPDNLATQLKIITKKPILPSESEISINPRSRSAKLRVAKKI